MIEFLVGLITIGLWLCLSLFFGWQIERQTFKTVPFVFEKDIWGVAFFGVVLNGILVLGGATLYALYKVVWMVGSYILH